MEEPKRRGKRNPMSQVLIGLGILGIIFSIWFYFKFMTNMWTGGFVFLYTVGGIVISLILMTSGLWMKTNKGVRKQIRIFLILLLIVIWLSQLSRILKTNWAQLIRDNTGDTDIDAWISLLFYVFIWFGPILIPLLIILFSINYFINRFRKKESKKISSQNKENP